MTDTDIIDTLAGLAPGSPLALIRDRKPVTRQQAQASYRALFEPTDTTNVTLQERFIIARFIAGLHAQGEIGAFYAAGLARTEPPAALVTALSAEIASGLTIGPYGAYPSGPLSVEDVPGPVYRVTHRDVVCARLTAALEHVHLLVFHPRDASAGALRALLDAGWSNTDIVTLSQLVAFLAFQIRAVVGLKTLAGSVP